MANQTAILDALSAEQRVTGAEIVEKLRKFYKTTDGQLEDANFLTRFFCWIRESCFGEYPNPEELIDGSTYLKRSTRFLIESAEEAKDKFYSYAPPEFLRLFPGLPDSGRYSEHPTCRNTLSNPYRIVAKEEAVQALCESLI